MFIWLCSTIASNLGGAPFGYVFYIFSHFGFVYTLLSSIFASFILFIARILIWHNKFYSCKWCIYAIMSLSKLLQDELRAPYSFNLYEIKLMFSPLHRSICLDKCTRLIYVAIISCFVVWRLEITYIVVQSSKFFTFKLYLDKWISLGLENYIHLSRLFINWG